MMLETNRAQSFLASIFISLIQALDKQVRAEVDEAIEWAKASPEPPVSDLFTKVYVDGTEPPTLRGRDIWETHRFSQ